MLKFRITCTQLMAGDLPFSIQECSYIPDSCYQNFQERGDYMLKNSLLEMHVIVPFSCHERLKIKPVQNRLGVEHLNLVNFTRLYTSENNLYWLVWQ